MSCKLKKLSNCCNGMEMERKIMGEREGEQLFESKTAPQLPSLKLARSTQKHVSLRSHCRAVVDPEANMHEKGDCLHYTTFGIAAPDVNNG